MNANHKSPTCRLLWLICAFLSLPVVASARSSEPEWKAYAFAHTTTDVALFYLSSEVSRPETGKVQVWVKAVSIAVLNKRLDLALKQKQPVIDVAVTRVGSHYIPTLATLSTLTKDQTIDITLFEAIADEAVVQPVAKILFELDCTNRMYRYLTLLGVPGKLESDANRPGAWQYVPPESPIQTLSKLTCSS